MTEPSRFQRPIRHARRIGKIFEDLFRLKKIETPKLNSNSLTSINIINDPGPDPEDGCCCARVIMVSKDGMGDFEVIQDAIDFAATQSPPPSLSAPFVIKICPGYYYESLVLADGVSLEGTGNREEVIVTSLLASVIVAPPTYPISCSRITFVATIDAFTQGMPTVSMPYTSGLIFNNCKIRLTGVDSQTNLFLLNSGGGVLKIRDCDLQYSITGVEPLVGGINHSIFNIHGSDNIEVWNSRVSIEQPNLTCNSWIAETFGGSARIKIIGSDILLIANNAGGSNGVLIDQGTLTNFEYTQNITSLSASGGGLGLYTLQNPIGNATLKSIGNRVDFNWGVQAFWVISADGLSSVESYFDQFNDIPYLSVVPILFVNSQNPGALSKSNPPFARTFLTTPVPTIMGIALQIPWDGETEDLNNIHAIGVGTFTCPWKGRYNPECQLVIQAYNGGGASVDATFILTTLVNGIVVNYTPEDKSCPAGSACTHIFHMQQDDTYPLLKTDVITFEFVYITTGAITVTIMGEPTGAWCHATVEMES